MLVLNATFEPINVCTVRRATVLLLKDKAEVVEVGSVDLHWATGSLPRPVVIRLVTYVRIPRDSHKRKITRRAVFAFAGVNLVRIESRPLRRKMGEYMFFLDLEGSTGTPAVAGAVADLHKHAEVVRVLGSFGT